jgi:hypothetical protein
MDRHADSTTNATISTALIQVLCDVIIEMKWNTAGTGKLSVTNG